jgi:cell division GTPase FtsZ
MKPADRALNMVVVGLGQAGGNLASEFARLGYRAIALNTAHTDLSSLASTDRAAVLSSDQRIYIGIDGYDGAGADMNYGRECIRENAERIREVVARHAEGADVVILTAGLGGGTGSSVSELVAVLSVLDLPMITLATLPNEYESGIAKVNAVRAVSDLVKHENIGWIFADNSRLSTQHGGVSLDKYFEKINSVIIRPLDELNRLNNRKGIHPIRSLDGEDFRALLLSNGVLNYSEGLISVLTTEKVIERVRESLQQSSMMPSGFALEEIAYMGVVLEAGEEVLRGTPFSFFEQLNEKLKNETGGAAIYMGVYRLDAPVDGGSARLRVIASTQSLPEGIQAMVNDARREGGTLRDKLQRSISSLDLGEIEEFDLFRTTLRTGHGQQSVRRRPGKPTLAVPESPVRRATDRARTGTPSSSPTAAADADAEPDPGASRPVFSSLNQSSPSVPPGDAGYASQVQSIPPVATGSEPAAPMGAGRGGSEIPPSVRQRMEFEAAVVGVSGDGGQSDATHLDVSEDTSVVDDGRAETSGVFSEAALEEHSAVELSVSDLVSESSSKGPLSEPPLSNSPPSSLRPPALANQEHDDNAATSYFPPPHASSVVDEWSGTKYLPGTEEYNSLDPQRQAEAASYQKLVATFLRTEFDSTKRRVARRLDAARRSEDALSRDLAFTALERLKEESQEAAFEAILTDGVAVTL